METDTITIEAVRMAEVAADRADLFVTVRGAALFTGDEALKKAREVANLVGELTALGLRQDDVRVQGISAEVASGAVLKTSQVSYRLKIHCARLGQLADILGVVTAQKNAEMQRIQWGYPDEEGLRDDLLRQCLARAGAKAQIVAAGLGVSVNGVHAFTEVASDPEAAIAWAAPAAAEAALLRQRRVTSEGLGLEVSHTKTLGVRVSVHYRVSDGLTAGGSD